MQGRFKEARKEFRKAFEIEVLLATKGSLKLVEVF